MSKILLLIVGMAAFFAVIHVFFPGIRGRISASRITTRLSLLPRSDYVVISNIPFQMPSGRIVVRHVVVSRFGIFVILVKNISGQIFGSESEEKWTQRYFNRERSFRNPLFRCHQQISLVRSVSRCTKKAFFPVIVFAGGASIWVDSSLDITTPFYLNRVIRAHDRVILTESEVQDIAVRLSEQHFRAGEDE